MTLFHAEEEEAEQRDAEKDVQKFKAACNEIRNAMRDIQGMKKRKTVSGLLFMLHNYYIYIFFTDGILVLHKAGNHSSILGSLYPVISSILPVKMSVYKNTLLILKNEIQLSVFDK